MKKKLNRSFYTKPTLDIAKKLLGKYIVRKIGRKELAGRIIETEAYIGPQDRASHAFGNKKTSRNQAEFLIGGHIYIYLVYGMYWQLNFSTAEQGKPECVLIRAIEVSDRDISLTNGPGKLCNYLKLDKSFYGEDLTKSKRIWLENRGENISPSEFPSKARKSRFSSKARGSYILATARIGIDYAGPYWSHRKYRFLIKGFNSGHRGPV